jgi:hypothetical protein
MPDFESMTEALISCVKCCGGSKAVGHKLWPEKTVDAAQRHLLACLNDDKAERLTPEQVLLLMRMGHERGCHDVMRYIAAVVGYAPPQPVEPKDEAAELRRQFIETGRQISRIAERLEALETRPALRSAA